MFEFTVEPVGTDRFCLFLTGLGEDGTRTVRFFGPNPLGFTEDDLRSPDGLAGWGLTPLQASNAIAMANDKRRK